ncbi:MAG: sensor histidine kinase [Pseudomonas sp.]|uniref:sensor histidine kinase n=1 Tax=Pseudomonas sp. TaxID=306 RepID=UPI003D10AC9E
MSEIDLSQLLERYRSISRSMQNEIQNASKAIETLKSKYSDIHTTAIDSHIKNIQNHWSDLSGWILVSTLEDIEEARNNCAIGVIDLRSKITRSKLKIKSESTTKNLTIKTNSIIDTKISTYIPYFEQLLDLLISNAAKYSPAASTIEIEADRNKNGTYISVISTGPLIEKSELQHIGTKGFRSAAAQKLLTTGQGYGLYNALKICTLIHAKLTITPSHKEQYTVRGVPFSTFEARIQFNE